MTIGKRTMSHQFTVTAAKRALQLSTILGLAVLLLSTPVLHSQVHTPSYTRDYTRYILPNENHLYSFGFVFGRCGTSLVNSANARADILNLQLQGEVSNLRSSDDISLITWLIEIDRIDGRFEGLFRDLDISLQSQLESCARAQITANSFISGPSSNYSYVVGYTGLSPLNIRWLAYPRRID